MMTETMTFTSLPEGGTTTVKSGKYGPFNQTKREAETRWVLGKNADGDEVVADLTTHHDPDSKVFRSYLTWGVSEVVDRHPSDGPGVVSVYRWASDHLMVTASRVPVARYSKRALEETHARVLEAVAGSFEVAYARVFNEAAERNGLVA